MSATLDKLVLGTWQLGSWEDSSHSKIKDIYKAAYDLGIYQFDSAESYGDGLAEMVLGRAFKDIIKSKREKIKIYSKFSHHHSSYDLMKKSLLKSLKRLNTDYLDVYFQHWPSPRIESLEVLSSLKKLKEEGLIKATGLSNSELSDFDNIDKSLYPDYIQNCYHPLWRKEEENFFSFCKENNIKFTSYSALMQGIFNKADLNSYSLKDPRRSLIYYRKELLPKLGEFNILLEELSKKYQTSAASILLCWNIQKPHVSKCIFAVNNLLQLKDCLSSIDSMLELSELDNIYKDIEQEINSFPSMWDWSPRN